MNQYVPVAVLEELADSVVVVEGVVDAAEVVLTDELAVAVRGGDLFVEQVSVAHAGELAGRRVLRASLLTCGESVDIVFLCDGGTCLLSLYSWWHLYGGGWHILQFARYFYTILYSMAIQVNSNLLLTPKQKSRFNGCHTKTELLF